MTTDRWPIQALRSQQLQDQDQRRCQSWVLPQSASCHQLCQHPPLWQKPQCLFLRQRFQVNLHSLSDFLANYGSNLHLDAARWTLIELRYIITWESMVGLCSSWEASCSRTRTRGVASPGCYPSQQAAISCASPRTCDRRRCACSCASGSRWIHIVFLIS